MDEMSGGTVGGAGGCLVILLVIGLIGGLVLALAVPAGRRKPNKRRPSVRMRGPR